MRVRPGDGAEVAGRRPLYDDEVVVAGLEVEPQRAGTGHFAVKVAQATLFGDAEGPSGQVGGRLGDVEPALVEPRAAF